MTHSATFDFWPHGRRVLRATPHGKRPLLVPEYEEKFGKKAKDRVREEWRKLGVADALDAAGDVSKPKGYND